MQPLKSATLWAEAVTKCADTSFDGGPGVEANFHTSQEEEFHRFYR